MTPNSRLYIYILVLILLCVTSWLRSFIFENEVTMWGATVMVSPRKARPHNNYGHALKEMKRLEEARIEFERALELTPDYPDALNNLSTIYNSMGRRPEAIRLLQRTLDLDPEHLQAKSNLALFYYESGLLEEAAGEYFSIMRLAPLSKEAGFAQSMVMLIRKQQVRR